MRELRHALGDKVRQTVEVSYIRRHNRVGKFVRKYPVEVVIVGAAVPAVGIADNQRIVVAHVDGHCQLVDVAGRVGVEISCRHGAAVFALEAEVKFVDGRGRVGAETVVAAVGLRVEIERRLSPPGLKCLPDVSLTVGGEGAVANGGRVAPVINRGKLHRKPVRREGTAGETVDAAAFGNDRRGGFGSGAARVGAGYRAGIGVAEIYTAVIEQEVIRAAGVAAIVYHLINCRVHVGEVAAACHAHRLIEPVYAVAVDGIQHAHESLNNLLLASRRNS